MLGLEGLGLVLGSAAGAVINPTFPVVRNYALPAGDQALYTVPAGKKALVVDLWVTNPTAGSITYFPKLTTPNGTFQIGASVTEGAAGIGHNYGNNGTLGRSIPIVLNAGEIFIINSSALGMSVWVSVIEFDASSALSRWDIQTWVNGNNVLYTHPAGKTVVFGNIGYSSTNSPVPSLTGVVISNGSGSTRTYVGPYIVPSAGSPSTANQFGGSNAVFNGSIFTKYFPGGLAAGDTIVITTSDANNTGQIAWVNGMQF